MPGDPSPQSTPPLPPGKTSRPRGFSPWRTLPLIGILAGFVVTTVGYYLVREAALGSAEREFLQMADHYSDVLSEEVDGVVASVNAIGLLYVASEEVTSKEFARFVESLIRDNLSMRALLWAPRISDASRPAFMRSGQKRFGADFEVKEFFEAKILRPAPERREYFPLSFVEPRLGNESLPGFDLASEPTIREALERARDWGWFTATLAPAPLRYSSTEVSDVLLILPIYENGTDTSTLEGRRAHLQGYAVGLYQPLKTLRLAQEAAAAVGIAVRLQDETDPASFALLGSIGWEEAGPRSSRGTSFTSETLLEVGGRQWRLKFQPVPGGPFDRIGWIPPVAFGVGLLFTLLLTLYFGSISDRSEKLRESEERYRLLVEEAPEAICVLDPRTGMFVDINRHAETLFKMSREKILRLSPVAVSPWLQPDGRRSEDAALAYVEKALEGDLPRFEWVHVDSEGREILCEITLSRLPSEKGDLVRGSLVDIAERKRAEQDRMRLSAVLDTTTDFVGWAGAKDQKVVYVNPAGRRLLGITQDHDVRGDHISNYHPAWAYKIISEVAIPLAIREGSWRGETAFVSRDGREIATSQVLLAHKNDRGEVEFFSTIARDISERVARENRIRKHDLLLRELAKHNWLAESSQDAALAKITEMAGHALDLDGVGICTYAPDHSRMVCADYYEPRLHRHSRQRDLDAKSAPLFLELLEKDRIVDAADAIGDPRTKEIAGNLKEIGVTSFLSAAVHLEGRVVGMLCGERKGPPSPWPLEEQQLAASLSDIVALVLAQWERRREEQARLALERKMVDSQKLESLGILAGGIAHDFNNLLMGVLANASLALLEAPPSSPLRESLRQIETAARRASDLTRQLLAYSGKGRFVVERISLNQVIEEMADLVRITVSKNAALRQELAPNLPPIEADTTQIRQVIMNLLLNASEALGGKGGTISLVTSSVEATREYLEESFSAPGLPAGRYVSLEVSDTGAGMDAETRSRIFDPFFTTKSTGRGLGLSAVLGIIRGHKGALKVYSEPGQGTTFRILLPAADGALSRTTPETGGKKAAALGGLALVIDDEEIVRTTTDRMLRWIGFEVLSAPRGVEGLSLFRANQGSLAVTLLDMTMPGMSGIDVFKEIQRIQPGATVVLMSGYNEQDAISRLAGRGLAGFLQKPFTAQELAEKLRQVLGKTKA
ncbi:MAG: CHASE domain-containing protein [Bdellovibrionota bacterium]